MVDGGGGALAIREYRLLNQPIQIIVEALNVGARSKEAQLRRAVGALELAAEVDAPKQAIDVVQCVLLGRRHTADRKLAQQLLARRVAFAAVAGVRELRG